MTRLPGLYGGEVCSELSGACSGAAPHMDAPEPGPPKRDARSAQLAKLVFCMDPRMLASVVMELATAPSDHLWPGAQASVPACVSI